MGKSNKAEGLTVIVRNSSGTRITYPDGRVEGYVRVSAKRHAMVLETINRSRREEAMRKNEVVKA